MKHISILSLFLVLTAAVALSCSKMDDNGDLGGNWQLTEWRNTVADTVVATNSSRIYFTVQKELVKLQCLDAAVYYLATFRHTADSLCLETIYQQPYDSVVAPSDLTATLGVDATGRFHIDALSSEYLVLSTPSARLTFRKY